MWPHKGRSSLLWLKSNRGQVVPDRLGREVQSELRKVLWLKYKLKDNALFERAEAYIKEYY